MKQEQKLDANDKKLQELIRWMLDNYTIRQMLKELIIAKEKQDNIWLMKQIFNAKPEDPGGDLFFKRK